MPRTITPRSTKPKARKQIAHACRVCACTNKTPCHPRCAWSERDLCSTCLCAIVELADMIEPVLRGVIPERNREVAGKMIAMLGEAINRSLHG